MELIIVLTIVLLVFGPKRLPGLGRQVGSSMREFKDSLSGDNSDDAAEQPRQVQAASMPTENAEAAVAHEDSRR